MGLIDSYALTRKFGSITAVASLSFEVQSGEVLGLLGPNGAGKTTTIRMMTGMIVPTSGYAVIAGLRPDKQPEALHELIGILNDNPGMYPNLTARRNLEYFAGFYRGKAQIEKYLKLMGLWERRDSKAGTFSKGMKQRLALARALMHEPKILFLDEPTSGLDPEAARDIRQLITNLSKEGITILLSTHNLSEAEQLCGRIAVMRNGLLALDRPGNMRQRFFQREVTIKLESLADLVLNAVKKLTYVKESRVENNQVVVVLAEPERNLPELIKTIVDAGGKILEAKETPHSLEEIYLKLVQEEKQ